MRNIWILAWCISEQHRRSGKDLTCRRTCRILKGEYSAKSFYWVEPIVSCCLHIWNCKGETFRSWGVVHMARCQLEEFDVPWYIMYIGIYIYIIRVCCNATNIVNIFGLFLLKSNGCRSIFARTRETIRRRPADSICQDAIQTPFPPDSLTFLVIFQVAVKVIRNFTQDLLAAIQSAQGWSDMLEVVGFGVFDMLFRNRWSHIIVVLCWFSFRILSVGKEYCVSWSLKFFATSRLQDTAEMKSPENWSPEKHSFFAWFVPRIRLLAALRHENLLKVQIFSKYRIWLKQWNDVESDGICGFFFMDLSLSGPFIVAVAGPSTSTESRLWWCLHCHVRFWAGLRTRVTDLSAENHHWQIEGNGKELQCRQSNQSKVVTGINIYKTYDA